MGLHQGANLVTFKKRKSRLEPDQLYIEETKMNQNDVKKEVWTSTLTLTHYLKYTTSSVKHGGGNVIVRARGRQ